MIFSKSRYMAIRENTIYLATVHSGVASWSQRLTCLLKTEGSVEPLMNEMPLFHEQGTA